MLNALRSAIRVRLVPPLPPPPPPWGPSSTLRRDSKHLTERLQASLLEGMFFSHQIAHLRKKGRPSKHLTERLQAPYGETPSTLRRSQAPLLEGMFLFVPNHTFEQKKKSALQAPYGETPSTLRGDSKHLTEKPSTSPRGNVCFRTKTHI